MFIVMVPNYWAKGDTIDEAFAKIRKMGGGKKRTRRIVFEYDATKTPEAFVDEYGSLCWKGDRPREVERVGVEEKR